MEPSIHWQETVAPDEEARFTAYADGFKRLQEKNSAKYGKGRALHRKQVLGLPATLDIPEELPLQARFGLFARPGRYTAWVRLSNGGAETLSDRRPDVRGFAFKVHGVSGAGALGGQTQSQDFALINLPAFAFPSSEEFVGLVLAIGEGPLGAIRYLRGRYGVLGALALVRRMAKAFGKPFRGFEAENFYSAAPVACGPYAARVRLVPVLPSAGSPKSSDFGAALRQRLEKGSVPYDLQLQFFVDEERTPIEDASVDWDETVSPYVTVGRLTLTAARDWSGIADRLSREIEAAIFDPWCALAEHRPLGDVMRARKVVYFASQQARGVHG